MKNFLLISSVIFITSVKSQILLQENFNAPFNPLTNGWSIQNLSASPSPTYNWVQGTSNNFSSYNGGPNDYISSFFLATSSATPATISVWLITPTLTIVDGCVLEFATRTNNNPASYADRLEVNLSTAGAGLNVGTTPTSLGSFSTGLVSINPSLTATGYPNVWTVYSVTITGVPSPVTGRIGFRYFVTNGGGSQQAINSDYIGLDAVKYSGPCTATLPEYTTCPGQSVTLNASGVPAGTTYTWSQGGINSSSIVVNPTATTVYTLNYSSMLGNCPSKQATVTIGTQLNMNLTTIKNPICPGDVATLFATGAATSYTWSSSQLNSQSITVTPFSTTMYTITGSSTTSTNVCVGTNTFLLVVFPQSTINTVISPSVICTGKSYTISASGAGLFYYWSDLNGNFSYSPRISTTPTLSGLYNFWITGNDLNGCTATKQITFNINQTPTITVNPLSQIICLNESSTIIASGADSYLWDGVVTSTTNTYIYTGTTVGPSSVIVKGKSTEGCLSTSAVVDIEVSVCASVSETELAETTIFPNPMSDKLVISGYTGTIRIYNMAGKIALETYINNFDELNTEAFQKGMYLFQFINESGRIVKSGKLIKQ